MTIDISTKLYSKAMGYVRPIVPGVLSGAERMIGRSPRLQRFLLGAINRPEGLNDRELILKLLPSIFHSMVGSLFAINGTFNVIEMKFKKGIYGNAEELQSDIQRLKGPYANLSRMITTIKAFFDEGSERTQSHYIYYTLMQYEILSPEYYRERGISFEIDYSGLNEHRDRIVLPGKDLHAILTGLIMGPAAACVGRIKPRVKIVAATESRAGKDFIRVTTEDNGAARLHPLAKTTLELTQKHGGFIEIDALPGGITKVSVYFPKNRPVSRAL
ncbi:MAG: hypothetical protein WC632_01685 [Candidatus Margulisiibacteriota bacterium]